MNSRMRIIGMSVGLMLVLATGATWAWAEGDDALYYACVNNASGTIHLVDPGDTCNNNEQLVMWNSRGPTGAQGPQGEQGPAGPQGQCSCEISRAEFDALAARVEALESQQCEDSDLDGYGIGPDCLGPDCDDGNPEVHPGVIEVCDGLDNDCDGEVDEEFPTQGQACDGPDADSCPEGVMECIAGSPICSDNTGDNEEVCDGIDNDCDGQVDEGC